MFNALIITAIVSLVLVSLAHSIIGERRLIGPLLDSRSHPVLDNDLGRFVVRYAWHATSIMWMAMAVILYAIAFAPENLSKIVLWAIGGSFTFMGVFDLIGSQGKHVGWPLLSAIGVFSLAAGFAS